jgi:hypothetical protein
MSKVTILLVAAMPALFKKIVQPKNGLAKGLRTVWKGRVVTRKEVKSGPRTPEKMAKRAPGTRHSRTTWGKVVLRPTAMPVKPMAARTTQRALAGHHSVGGIRASLYHAIGSEICQALASFMSHFRKANG